MELWKHQREAIARATPMPHYALLMEPGTGKSATLINILRQKFTEHGMVLRTLILCPTVVCDNWKREWVKFSKVPEYRIVVLDGTGKERAKIINEEINNKTAQSNRIFICNYQTLLMPKVIEALASWGPEVIVADESHRLKTPNAKTTKAAIKLASHSTYRYILTGTPVLKSLMDFFSQFKFLDGGETFGPDFNFFMRHYFYNANANAPAHITWPEWRVRPNAVKEIQDKVFKKSTYAEKSQCLDLPELVRKKIYVDMSGPQEKAYKQMESLFITYVDGKAVVATIALTMGLRLMQIVSGFVKTEDGEEKRFANNPRLDALRELLSDVAPDHKVIVWACFKENYGAIKEVCENLKLKAVELHGGTTDREGSIRAFQEDETVRVLIGNQGAGGIGVNLTAASYAIYFSRNFSLEHNLQSEARNYRGGSEVHKKITRIDLVTKGTIDEQVLDALDSKQAISDSVLRKMVKQ